MHRNKELSNKNPKTRLRHGRLRYVIAACLVFVSMLIPLAPSALQGKASAADVTYLTDTNADNVTKAVRYYYMLQACADLFKTKVVDDEISKGPRWWVRGAISTAKTIALPPYLAGEGKSETGCNGDSDDRPGWIQDVFTVYGLDGPDWKTVLTTDLGYTCSRSGTQEECTNTAAPNKASPNGWLKRIVTRSPYLNGTTPTDSFTVTAMWYYLTLRTVELPDEGCAFDPSGTASLMTIHDVDESTGAISQVRGGTTGQPIKHYIESMDSMRNITAGCSDGGIATKLNQSNAEAYAKWIGWTACSDVSGLSKTLQREGCAAGWLHKTDYSYCVTKFPDTATIYGTGNMASYREACFVGQGLNIDTGTNKTVGSTCYDLERGNAKDTADCIYGAQNQTCTITTSGALGVTTLGEACQKGLTIKSVPGKELNSQTATEEEASPSSDNCPLAPSVSMRWLGCAVFEGLHGATDWLTTQLDTFLYTDPALFNNKTQQAATTFRNIAMALVVIAGLTMVISQALGLDLLDAYTIRKLLPKLGIALIGIALAWPLLKLAVTLTNDIGGMVYSLFMQIAGTSGAVGGDVGVGSGLVTVLGGFVATAGATVYAVVLGPIAFLSLLGSVALALLIGLLVLSVRQLVIFMAIILAPLAIAAYAFPGGEKLWKFWKTTLITTLIMYPLIMGFIGAGAAMSYLISYVMPPDSGGMSILAIIVYFAPFFMLPFAFKLAGGLMTTVFSLTNDKSRGVFDRMSKYRANARKQRWQEYATGQRGKGRFGQGIGKLAAYQTAISDPGVGITGLMSSRGRQNTRRKLSEARTAEAVRNNMLGWTADDFATHALQDATGKNDYIKRYVEIARARGVTDSEETLSRKAMDSLRDIEHGTGTKLGTQAMQRAAWQALQLSKTGYEDSEEGVERRIEDTRRAVKKGLVTTTEAAGILKASSRTEVSQASYSDLMNAIDGIDAKTGQAITGTAAELVLRSAKQNMTPGALIGMRKESMTLITGQMEKDMVAAYQEYEVAAQAASGPGASQQDKDKATAAAKRLASEQATYSGMRDTINSQAPELAERFSALSGAKLGTYQVTVKQDDGTEVTETRDLTVRVLEEAIKYQQTDMLGPGAQDIIRKFLDERREWSTTDIGAHGGVPPQAMAPPAAPGGSPPGTPGPAPGSAGPPGGGAPSDARLKSNISHVATLPSGIRLYKFKYRQSNDDTTYVGVMAQEMLITHPQAVGSDKSGYLYVNYAMLGLRMASYTDWLNNRECILAPGELLENVYQFDVTY